MKKHESGNRDIDLLMYSRLKLPLLKNQIEELRSQEISLLLESLENDSRKLSCYTKGLLAITIVLTVLTAVLILKAF